MTRFDATDRRPVDKWTAAPRPTTSPQSQQPQQKRSTHMVHKPVNSECSRHLLRNRRVPAVSRRDGGIEGVEGVGELLIGAPIRRRSAR